MNNSNIIFVWADLGSAKNFVKNLILLSPNVHMMHNVKHEDKMHYFKNQIYPDYLKDKLNSWFAHEYKLRQYKTEYGYDFTEESYDGKLFDIILNDQAKHILQDKKIVFTIHDFESIKKIKKTYTDAQIFYVCPEGKQATLWQIRAYCEKKGYKSAHNFTFEKNIEENKKTFIEKYGIDEYVKTNLINMTEVIDSRQQEWKQWALQNNVTVIDLEDVLLNKTQYIDQINAQAKININLNQAKELYTMWQKLHWPYEETIEWAYSFLENHINNSQNK